MFHVALDLRHAMRRLAVQPGFAAAIMLTLALAIGAACLYLDVVDAVLLRPAPYADPQRLVYVWETDAHNATSRESVSWPDFRDWRQQTGSFSEIAGYTRESLSLTAADSEPERIATFATTSNLFSMLGVHAQLGRLLKESDDVAQAAPVVVLSNELWQRRFGGSPGVIGTMAQLDGIAHEVVGVLPALPGAPLQPAAWTPLQRALGGFAEERGVHTLTAIARLRDDKSPAQAQQEMDAVAARLDSLYPNDNVGRGARVETLHDYAVRDVRDPLLLLGGVFLLLMLVAVANVANLLLARASTRRQELAVRTAIGAGRVRLVRQLAVEGALLGALGGCGGVLLTYLALLGLRAFGPADLLDLASFHLGARIIITDIATAAALCAASAVLPLLRMDISDCLRGNGLRAQTRNANRTRLGLVGVQVAFATLLALTSGLLLHSFWQLTRTQTGLVSENAIAFSVSLPKAQFPMPPSETYPLWPAATQFYDRVLAQVRGVDGVRAAALSHARPLRRNWTTRVHRADIDDPQSLNDEWEMRPVSPGYFSTLGIALLRGRDVDAQDTQAAPLALLINDAAARRYFAGEDPVGKQVLLWNKPRIVIGVVGDVRSLAPNEAALPAMFPPLAQTPFGDVTLVVRTERDPLQMIAALRSAIWRAQGDLALFNIATLDQEIWNAQGGARFGTGTVAAFALLALVLAAIGIFGVVAIEVSQRTAEIGLRLALGARAADVLALTLRRILGVVLLGAGAATIMLLLGGGMLRSVLNGVSATDPLAIAVALCVLLAVVLFAAGMPARRALRVDPMRALRYE
jgi:putative ABC transport system permease protein